MTLDELIARLTNVRASHGNLDVEVRNMEFDYNEIVTVEVGDCDNDDGKIVTVVTT